jgi:hypothetical protein
MEPCAQPRQATPGLQDPVLQGQQSRALLVSRSKPGYGSGGQFVRERHSGGQRWLFWNATAETTAVSCGGPETLTTGCHTGRRSSFVPTIRGWRLVTWLRFQRCRSGVSSGLGCFSWRSPRCLSVAGVFEADGPAGRRLARARPARRQPGTPPTPPGPSDREPPPARSRSIPHGERLDVHQESLVTWKVINSFRANRSTSFARRESFWHAVRESQLPVPDVEDKAEDHKEPSPTAHSPRSELSWSILSTPPSRNVGLPM